MGSQKSLTKLTDLKLDWHGKKNKILKLLKSGNENNYKRILQTTVCHKLDNLDEMNKFLKRKRIKSDSGRNKLTVVIISQYI